MTDGQTDRQTDRGDCNIPDAFLKKRGDNKTLLPTKLLLPSHTHLSLIHSLLNTHHNQIYHCYHHRNCAIKEI